MKTFDSDSHSFDFQIKRPRWTPFFAEEHIVPRFNVKIRNKGKPIDRGSVDFQFVEDDNLSDVYVKQKPWQGFGTHTITNFQHGQVLRFKVKIASFQMKPGRFTVRFVVRRNVPISPEEKLADLGFQIDMVKRTI